PTFWCSARRPQPRREPGLSLADVKAARTEPRVRHVYCRPSTPVAMHTIDPHAFLEPAARNFYCTSLCVFESAGLDVLIGGAYAFAHYTGIERHTKDLDVFVRRRDFERTLKALERAGFQTEVPF